MKRIFLLVMIAGLGFTLAFGFGCTKKSSSANEAIESSKALNTVQEKVDYLMKQANAFYGSQEFQQAIQIAQYVLRNLDGNSQSAKDLIEKAKAKLQESAQKAAGDVTKKLLGN